MLLPEEFHSQFCRLRKLLAQAVRVQVSSAEQEVSCSGSSMQGHFDAIAELINSNSISNADRCAGPDKGQPPHPAALCFQQAGGRMQVHTVLRHMQDAAHQSTLHGARAVHRARCLAPMVARCAGCG